MIYLELFLSFFQMGLFGFGGGYAVLPLIKEQVVCLLYTSDAADEL